MANRVKVLETMIHIGDTIDVHQKIKEAEKERIQVFQGVVICIKGRENGKSFIVRRTAVGSIGVERIWPVICPSITKVVVKKHGRVRRAKLYYLRDKLGKKATRVKGKISIKEKEEKKGKQNAEKKPRKSGRKSSPKTSKK